MMVLETGRRLGDRFREYLRDVEKDDKDASQPVAWHFNLPDHPKEKNVYLLPFRAENIGSLIKL